ncbi:hypothetical protein [Priestia megaterium]|uniref:hypothetical protein n=1 Tax=Priestia megaterium TaxID=1404 RepID=UPI0039A0A159
MDLLSVKIFITFSTTISTDFNVGTFNLDTILSAVALYYTIKQERRVKRERQHQKQTAQK